MVVPKKLLLYAAGGYVFDELKRNPWEVAGGASFYPFGNRSWRLNAARHPDREEPDRVELRLLHRRPERDDLLALHGHPAVAPRTQEEVTHDGTRRDSSAGARPRSPQVRSGRRAACRGPRRSRRPGLRRAPAGVRDARRALAPDQLHPGRHRHSRLHEDHGHAVGRVAIFGLPLQQQWDYANTGDFAPTYYLQTDAPLYYYSFTDAFIAMAYRSLPPEDQARLDPMITGFNPTDMYAADHIRRVLKTFPGVFSGIGEFSIHKEFVSAKIAGRDGQPAEPGPRPDPRLLRRGRASS